MKSVLSLGERSQVPHHRLVLGKNQGAGTITCSYCQQMGHMFNHYPFVDDKLRQLIHEEVMNTHQPIFPTIIIVVTNVSIFRTQAMNFSIGHITVLVNHQAT
jgi:hypothetical protein